MKIIVGLGNPGRKYECTRHNLGFKLIDQLADRAGVTVSREDGNALVQKATLADRNCLLVKPQTFMNLSGQAVARLVHKHQVSASADLLVIYDEVALPVGRLRMRKDGSAGGHNGMKSIIAQLGTQLFPRLRLGIKPVTPIDDLAEFVLSRFTGDEVTLVDEMLVRGEAAVLCWLQDGIDRAIALANREVVDSQDSNKKTAE